ncbi:MAG TPA: hypothetical protein VMR50_18140 [Myxococcota bacterium]|nr:hypothetical protein [Myxococcota bacterium]
MKRWTGVLWLAVCLVVAGRAEGFTYSTQTNTIFDATSLTDACSQTNDNGASSCGAGDSAFHTHYVDGFATALASVSNGQLHAHADVQAVLINDLYSSTPTRFFDESSAAIVSWGDRIVFTNPSQYAASPFGYVDITLTVEGLRSGAGAGGYATLDIPFAASSLHGGCSVSTVPGSCTGGGYVSFAGGASFSILLVANADAVFDTDLPHDASGVIPHGTTVTSIADYGDTAFIQAISFRDASGNPISLDYTSESGATYPAQAPEPGALAMTALIVSGAAAARRLLH